MNKIYEITIAILLFLVMQPYFIWGIGNFVLIKYALLALLMLKLDFKNPENIPLLFIFVLVLSIIPISKGTNLYGFLSVTFLAGIPFLQKQFAYNVLKIFKTIIVIVTAISIMVWVLVMIVHVNLPSTVIPPLNSLKSYDYIAYPFLVIPQFSSDISSVLRFCCVFDEPGVVGTYSILLLYIGRFNFKDKENIILLIAGFMSLSLFFYITLFIFVTLKIFTGRINIKQRFKIILGILTMIIFVLTVPVLNDFIASRLVFDKERNTIEGNNRSTEELDDYIESIRWTDPYLWGDSEFAIERFSKSASLNNAILRFGFVFIFCFFIFFFLYAMTKLKGNKKEVFLFILLLFLTLYQRPAFMNPTYIFLFSSVITYYIVDEEKRKALLDLTESQSSLQPSNT